MGLLANYKHNSTKLYCIGKCFCRCHQLRKLFKAKYKYLAHVATLRGFSSYYLNYGNAKLNFIIINILYSFYYNKLYLSKKYLICISVNGCKRIIMKLGYYSHNSIPNLGIIYILICYIE